MFLNIFLSWNLVGFSPGFHVPLGAGIANGNFGILQKRVHRLYSRNPHFSMLRPKRVGARRGSSCPPSLPPTAVGGSRVLRGVLAGVCRRRGAQPRRLAGCARP
jgi:hypothetical protein